MCRYEDLNVEGQAVTVLCIVYGLFRCLFVCLSVTSRSSVKAAKRVITQTYTANNFLIPKIRNSVGSPPTGAPSTRGVGKFATFDI